MGNSNSELSFKKNLVHLLPVIPSLFGSSYIISRFILNMPFTQFLSSPYFIVLLFFHALWPLSMLGALKIEQKRANDENFLRLKESLGLRQTHPFTLEGTYNGKEIKICWDLYFLNPDPLFRCLRISSAIRTNTYGTSYITSPLLSVTRTPIRGNKSFEDAYYVKGDANILNNKTRENFMELSNAGFTCQFTDFNLMPPKKSENIITAEIEIEDGAIKSPEHVKKAIEIVLGALNNYSSKVS